MGQCNAPSAVCVKEKESSNGASATQGLYWGVSQMQGWRDSMEDAHIAAASVADMASNSGVEEPGAWDDTAIFAVMDGHGGVQVARFIERHLPSELARCPAEDVGAALAVAIPRLDDMLASPKYRSELKALTWPSSGTAASRNLYDTFLADPTTMGSTCAVCCIRDEAIFVANVGDSRTVLCRGGKAKELSIDHKPTLQAEHDRIRKAGGWVDAEEERVNGDLALSRALGDLEYKQDQNLAQSEQIVSCIPDIRSIRCEAGDEFIVVACDGIWDVMTGQEVVSFVRERLGPRCDLERRIQEGKLALSEVVEELLDDCVSPGRDSGDNMTVILVVIFPKSAAAVKPGIRAVPAKHPLQSSEVADTPMRSVPCYTHYAQTPRSGQIAFSRQPLFP